MDEKSLDGLKIIIFKLESINSVFFCLWKEHRFIQKKISMLIDRGGYMDYLSFKEFFMCGKITARHPYEQSKRFCLL